ncbi:MAG TPA: pyocin knob domain-containing protein [Bilophila wadsworthia]|uniref:pyocin knob domain-containing protein n=1 Tax=Bilophila wadsworthia TaxID=35833 RepID=UPI001DE66609|nr:pyocin knob domain-containing protein [Bilophila wadsworthia]HJH14156.1 pyocin knob domain-containing protein [Bilophila wadsworthia]
MPDFQYQPPTGPLSGSEFERQTTRFFQQVQGAADAAQSTAIVAQNTANDALERAQASNFVDGKTTTDAGGVITVKDVAIGGDLEDLASARGQIGAARELGNNVDYNTVTKAGFYLINATGGVNGPIVGSAAFLQVFYSKKDAFIKNLYQIVYAYSPARERMFLRQYRLASNDWSSWSEIVSSSCIGDGLTVNNGIISVPEYDGATASTSGTSGLVPPAAAGQATYVLCGDGEWRDIATLVAAAQARLADKAAS